MSQSPREARIVGEVSLHWLYLGPSKSWGTIDAEFTAPDGRSYGPSLIDEHETATLSEKSRDRLDKVRGTEPGTAWYHQHRRTISSHLTL